MALWIEDENGNLNIDFLVGLVIFIGALLYLIMAIPSIFLPYQTNSVDLGSVVYRTSCLLAEDPGWYIDAGSGVNGTAWEYESTGDLIRVGLAVDKKTPDVLSRDKIMKMKSLPYVLSRDDLGLNNTMTYNYSLDIEQLLPDGTSETMLNVEDPGNPDWTSDVESIDRAILIRDGEGLYYDNQTFIIDGAPIQTTVKTSDLTVQASPCFDNTNATIRLTNFVPSDNYYSGFTVYYFVGPYYNSSAMVQAIEGNEYYLYRNGVYVDDADLETSPFNQGDSLDIIVNMRVIEDEYKPQGLNVSRILVSATPDPIMHTQLFPFPDWGSYEPYEAYNTTNPNYRYFDTKGMMTLQVWQV